MDVGIVIVNRDVKNLCQVFNHIGRAGTTAGMKKQSWLHKTNGRFLFFFNLSNDFFQFFLIVLFYHFKSLLTRMDASDKSKEKILSGFRRTEFFRRKSKYMEVF